MQKLTQRQQQKTKLQQAVEVLRGDPDAPKQGLHWPRLSHEIWWNRIMFFLEKETDMGRDSIDAEWVDSLNAYIYIMRDRLRQDFYNENRKRKESCTYVL